MIRTRAGGMRSVSATSVLSRPPFIFASLLLLHRRLPLLYH